MSNWRNISRARVMRYNAVFGVVCLVLSGIYVALVLAGAGGSGPIQWVLVGGFVLIGVLALVGASLMRGDEAQDPAIHESRSVSSSSAPNGIPWQSGDVTPTHDEVERLVAELEAEVNNGGFDQYFFNSAGDETVATIEALEVIAANKTAAIVRRACAKFPGGMPPSDRDARQTLLEEVSPDGHAFEAEDDAFSAYEDGLSALVASHASTP